MRTANTNTIDTGSSAIQVAALHFLWSVVTKFNGAIAVSLAMLCVGLLCWELARGEAGARAFCEQLGLDHEHAQY